MKRTKLKKFMSGRIHYPVGDPRIKQAQITLWIDRQISDEFRLLAQARNTSRAELLRTVMSDFVAHALRSPLENGKALDGQSPLV